MEELFKKYVDRNCSPGELLQLLSYFRDPENEARLRQLIRDCIESSPNEEEEESADLSLITDRAYTHILMQIQAEQQPQRPWSIKHWIGVAASLLFMVSIAAYFFYAERKLISTPEIQQEAVSAMQDILPGKDRATLTLADGTTVILDSVQNGMLTTQGGVQVQKKDGQVLYAGNDQKSGEIVYNMVTIPRGGQYQLVLADGTRVWLNAESSLRYPTSFSGNDREVYLTGEGYFEVSRNVKPFRVNIEKQMTVEVLGTHFNINAYSNEPTINTTLLEGSVKVFSNNSSGQLTLSPGHQSKLRSDGKMELNDNPDIEDVMAWKNGKFHFGDASDIHTIMNQIARWYDVEIVYEGKVTDHIGGTISRDVKASKVFEMLEMTGSVKFRIEGNTIFVMPQKK